MAFYLEGLKEAIQAGTETAVLRKYFEENKQEICFVGCQSLVVSEGVTEWRTIEINGNDQQQMSFIIQDERQNDLHRLDVKPDFSDIKQVFSQALTLFAEELKSISDK